MAPSLYSALLWSGGGFVLGWATCWLAIRSAQADATTTGGKRVRATKFELFRSFVGLAILILVVLSGISYYRTTSCQITYNKAVSQALTDRSEAQRVETQAQVELLTATLAGDREAAARETQKYISAIRELERVRAAAPLPPPPNCGDLT
ncbi:MAG: hypothetical protein WC054_01060 [Candidatus Nanopelagicales bacterium]